MLDIGFQELLIIMVVALLVFGPDKLPDLGRRLGRAMREFRRASDEFRSTVETNLRIHEDPLPPTYPMPEPTVTADASGSPEAGPAAGEAAPVPADEAVIAAGAPEGAAAPVNGEAAPAEPFWMRRGGRLLHRSACAWRSRVPEAERVGLQLAGEGQDLGLRPCPVCEPAEEARPA